MYIRWALARKLRSIPCIASLLPCTCGSIQQWWAMAICMASLRCGNGLNHATKGFSASREILPACLTGLGSGWKPFFGAHFGIILKGLIPQISTFGAKVISLLTKSYQIYNPTGPTGPKSMGLLGLALHHSTCGARNPCPTASVHTQRTDCTWSCGDMPRLKSQT